MMKLIAYITQAANGAHHLKVFRSWDGMSREAIWRVLSSLEEEQDSRIINIVSCCKIRRNSGDKGYKALLKFKDAMLAIDKKYFGDCKVTLNKWPIDGGIIYYLYKNAFGPVSYDITLIGAKY